MNDKIAAEYVEGVKRANPDKTHPTWEMLETAFVAGMMWPQPRAAESAPKNGTDFDRGTGLYD